MVIPMSLSVYPSLTCLKCKENPYERNLTAPHAWHGHIVTSNAGTALVEKILHGICKRCWPEVSHAKPSSCPCGSGNISAEMQTVYINPNGTLSTQEPETAPTEARMGLRNRLTRLQIPAPGIQQGDPQRLCHPVVTGVSAAALSASIIGAIVAGILFPPAIIPISIGIAVSGVVLFGELTGGFRGSNGPRSPDYGPPSPASYGID